MHFCLNPDCILMYQMAGNEPGPAVGSTLGGHERLEHRIPQGWSSWSESRPCSHPSIILQVMKPASVYLTLDKHIRQWGREVFNGPPTDLTERNAFKGLWSAIQLKKARSKYCKTHKLICWDTLHLHTKGCFYHALLCDRPYHLEVAERLKSLYWHKSFFSSKDFFMHVHTPTKWDSPPSISGT